MTYVTDMDALADEYPLAVLDAAIALCALGPLFVSEVHQLAMRVIAIEGGDQ